MFASHFNFSYENFTIFAGRPAVGCRHRRRTEISAHFLDYLLSYANPSKTATSTPVENSQTRAKLCNYWFTTLAATLKNIICTNVRHRCRAKLFLFMFAHVLCSLAEYSVSAEPGRQRQSIEPMFTYKFCCIRICFSFRIFASSYSMPSHNA